MTVPTGGEGRAVAKKSKADFADVLKAARARAGLTQKVLARRSRIPLATIQQWEQALREPTWGSLVKLAKGLGVDLGGLDPQAAKAAKKEG
jgi:transcriptional regulator with XRE-family HTH domain